MPKIHTNAKKMIETIIAENMPGHAVESALKGHKFKNNIHMIAVGKAAWTMADVALNYLGHSIKSGIVVTKYGHSLGPLLRTEIYECGHPISDENTFTATQKCIELAQNLQEDDELLFLISGGGSALFEKPQPGISLADIQNLTNQLLAKGVDIVEMNMVRKRLSQVKAGRFAALVEPAQVFAIVLSDVLGDKLDSIASGPAAPDTTTVADALAVIEKYKINLTDAQQKYIMQETPKTVSNVKTVITGSVRTLCDSAAKAAQEMGYTPYVLTTTMNCEASEAGRMLAAIAADTKNGRSSFKPPCAIIAGGETVVTLKNEGKGGGKGGRNQELVLSAVKGLAGLEGTLMFSIGSDGTDGPTDAAGGMVDGSTFQRFQDSGLNLDKVLDQNDSYNGLDDVDSLIKTGPTGTNVNDVTVVLIE